MLVRLGSKVVRPVVWVSVLCEIELTGTPRGRWGAFPSAQMQ